MNVTADWYDEHADGGSDFLGAVDETVEDIAMAPWRWPVVQGVSPSTRRRLSRDFVFDVGFQHPAVFSLDTDNFTIIPDGERDGPSKNGFLKSVSPSGDRIVVVQGDGEALGGSVRVYQWPTLAVVTRFRYGAPAWLTWRFGLDSDLLYGRSAGETDSIVQFNGKDRSLSFWVRVSRRDVAEYRQLDQATSLVMTKWVKSDVRFTDSRGLEHLVPRDELAYYLSATMTEDGDLLLARIAHNRSIIVRYHPADGAFRDVTDGPEDYSVSALPAGDWLVVRGIHEGRGGGIFRCSTDPRGTNPPCRQISTTIPIAGIWAAPGGKSFAYSVLGPQGIAVRLASLVEGAVVDLVVGASFCHPEWSSPTTLWFSRREGTEFRWTEIDVETREPTGRTLPGTSGCYEGHPDPAAPVARGVWIVKEHDSDIRVHELGGRTRR